MIKGPIEIKIWVMCHVDDRVEWSAARSRGNQTKTNRGVGCSPALVLFCFREEKEGHLVYCNSKRPRIQKIIETICCVI